MSCYKIVYDKSDEILWKLPYTKDGKIYDPRCHIEVHHNLEEVGIVEIKIPVKKVDLDGFRLASHQIKGVALSVCKDCGVAVMKKEV